MHNNNTVCALVSDSVWLKLCMHRVLVILISGTVKSDTSAWPLGLCFARAGHISPSLAIHISLPISMQSLQTTKQIDKQWISHKNNVITNWNFNNSSDDFVYFFRFPWLTSPSKMESFKNEAARLRQRYKTLQQQQMTFVSGLDNSRTDQYERSKPLRSINEVIIWCNFDYSPLCFEPLL